MKYLIIFLVVLFSGCAVPVKGKPFVDVKSGKPYATLKIADPQPQGLILLVDTIDNRRSMIEAIFRDELYAAKETYVEEGLHTVLVDCRNGMMAGMYLQAELTFFFEKDQVYTITCHSDSQMKSAKFSIVDRNGKNIYFDYKRHKE